MKRLMMIFALLAGFAAAGFGPADMCDTCNAAGLAAYTLCMQGGGDYNTCHAANMAAVCSCSIMYGCGDGIIIACGGGPN